MILNLIIGFIVNLLIKWLVEWLQKKISPTGVGVLPMAEDLAYLKMDFLRRVDMRIFLGRRRREIASRAFDMTVENLRNTAIRTSAEGRLGRREFHELANILTAGVQTDLESRIK